MSLLIGFLLVIGTLGAADTGRISWIALIVQIVIGLYLIVKGLSKSQAVYEDYSY